MKYWLLTTEYPPFFGGGISTYCGLTARMFAEKGHDVTVFVNDSNVDSVVVEQQNNIRVVRFSPYQFGANSFLGHTANVSYAFSQIVKQFIEQEGQPDIVEAQEYLGIAYYLLQYKYLLYEWCIGLKVLITMHSPSFLYMSYNHISEYKYPNFWICEMERFCLQAADFLVAPSHYIVKETERHFEILHKNVAVIPNPYEPQAPQPEKSHQQKTEIVFYGKLTVQKGALALLAYFNNLWEAGFAETLVMIGGQDIVYHPEGVTMGDFIRNKYQRYIDRGLLKLEDRIAPNQINSRLSKAKVVIIPSANDNLPYVVFEMMGMGNVVLVSKQGGHAEVVQHGVDGFIFDHFTEGDFELQLQNVLALTNEQWQNVSTNAKKKVAAYSLQTIYDQKIVLIDTICQKKEKTSVFPFVRLGNANKITVANKMLSVVIPYYNMGKYIEKTIESIERSDYKLKEIIIVNDGSTDAESIGKLKQYEDKPAIRIIHKKNKGLAAARNDGAAIASGGFLAFLDADDWVVPDYFSKAIKVLAYYPDVHFVGAWTRYFEGSSAVWPTFTPEPPIFLYQNTINSSSLVYKKEAFLKGGLNDAKMVFQGWEDYESVIALLANGYRGVVLPEILFFYRVRRHSMIRAISNNKKLYLQQYISNKHKFYYTNFAAELVNLLQNNGPAFKIDNPSFDYSTFSRFTLLNKARPKIIEIINNNGRLKRMALAIYKKFKS